ncbi:MAG: diversity-generating retroelement protein Avd [Anaerolineae bacterium]|nr:diversity-generating retroelement protein Avd [Anaerolineae bacterium]MDH7473005.1 diversity-generating retroelement protein Avd [Anaerolineae bacterium]
MKESPIFTRTYDFLRWLIPLTVGFPRHQRFVLAEVLQQTAIRFQEQIIEAARNPEPLSLLGQADTELAKLRLFLRLCYDLRLMSLGQYKHGTERLAEIGRLLGGWQKKMQPCHSS